MPKRPRTRSGSHSRRVRPSSAQRGYDRRWRKRRARKLTTDPWCELCHCSDRWTPAAEVHHILPLVDGGTHTWLNLMSLCPTCHRVVTNKWKNVRSAAGAKRAALQALELAGASAVLVAAVRATVEHLRRLYSGA